MAVQVACGAATACRRIRRSTRADVTLVAPTFLLIATFPCSNHLLHSRCTVDASRYDISMQIMFLITFILWIVTAVTGDPTIERKYWSEWDLTLVHEILLVVALFFSFFRLHYYFYQSGALGPIQVDTPCVHTLEQYLRKLTSLISQVLMFFTLCYLISVVAGVDGEACLRRDALLCSTGLASVTEMEDQRICIKFCVKNGFKGAEIF
ncbi:hypothetical protein LAZ67_3001829 [Cordylochernes scorpioides]|uniref:Uncharacterized protein n=1 Tax=Cordylochernes scorpioides TaxID=51811 RepID=A0ABY6KBY0_9ARAC|nr:hypothetical protein LAZ67_3001829 [Cordylochernes scorpioides]